MRVRRDDSDTSSTVDERVQNIKISIILDYYFAKLFAFYRELAMLETSGANIE